MNRIIKFLAPVLALWVLASFVGVMADPARAGFWTQSLMWGLLSGLVLAPVYAFTSATLFSESESKQAPQPSMTQESMTEETASPEPQSETSAESLDNDESREAPPTRVLQAPGSRKLWPTEEEEAVEA